MSLQYITDNTGAHTAVVIPIEEWEAVLRKYADLKNLETEPKKEKVKLSDYAGKLSEATADAMQNYVAESRGEWEERLKKQL